MNHIRSSSKSTCAINKNKCANAAACGRLKRLQWLRAQNPPCAWDANTCIMAARNGHLHVLQWAREQDPPCPWQRSCIIDAIEKQEKVPILIWVICGERTEVPHHIFGVDIYNMMRSLHSLLVVEILDEEYWLPEGDAMPKDIIRLIGSYADVSSLLFDDEAISNACSTVGRYYGDISPEFIMWLNSMLARFLS